MRPQQEKASHAALTVRMLCRRSASLMSIANGSSTMVRMRFRNSFSSVAAGFAAASPPACRGTPFSYLNSHWGTTETSSFSCIAAGSPPRWQAAEPCSGLAEGNACLLHSTRLSAVSMCMCVDQAIS